MKFSYNWLKDIVGFKETPQKIAERLTLRSFEIESIEKAGSDWALDVKIPANRISDAANHLGLAQEIAVSLGKRIKLLVIKKTFAKEKFPKISFAIARPDLAPRYTAASIRIKNIGVSPKWMQERLATCGFRPLNAVVDVTNYVMLEMGEPMHAFDLGKVWGRRMSVREARKGERIETLDGTAHTLPDGAIIIEDAERIIDLAGIMGGENSAVSEETKEIFLQAAVFDPVRIYRACRALNFSSAASKIYSAGIDAARTEDALWRAIGLLKECGVLVSHGDFIDLYPKKETPKKILFRPEYANRLIGEVIKPDFYKKIFTALGFQVLAKKDRWVVEVPITRRDISIEEDLIEEAVRFYGYENIRALMPEGGLHVGRENEEYAFESAVRSYFSSHGYSELLLHEFASESDLKEFSIDPGRALELENPLNPETAYLHPRIAAKYAASAAANIRNFDSVKIFGIAKSFRKRREGVGIQAVDEHKDFIVAIADKDAKGEKGFYNLKGALDGFFDSLGIAEHWYDDSFAHAERKEERGIFHPHRAAEIRIDGEKIGVIGEIHPVILENIKSRARIAVAEIDFNALRKHADAEREFRPIPKYPAIIRDISLVVPSDARVDDVLQAIQDAGGENLSDVDLFDYFEDEKMRKEEKRSLAFHLVFQAEDRTLTDGEVEKSVTAIVKALEQNRWEVRK
ncbi:MAG: phenylalanine--tRNA ligase subunit beta [Candidatus Sungbacteria bacterium GWC2_49_10]|uniref:Phenylalanine--tRNA ligase beta subunit n=2 Tax=Parcubacteria group TaxID=1794811 RepID=A0A0G1ZMS9_9BACT|nr:MAG: phenylalanyl-tRNA synthetase, beta subunit, phenylalanyl-tRNA synthetase beta chain [Candidatus Adlerbacteria bacterium GW2011_GWC1_50_9]OGZ93339.1 MAG: phenylalanine--tRNA ligase subunit beta [Candidatus Sungbacteria bacterium GWC2_49_10]